MYENYWQLGSRSVWPVPVRCVFSWRAVPGEKRLDPEREYPEGLGESGAVEVEAMIAKNHVGEKINEPHALVFLLAAVPRERAQRTNEIPS